MQTTTVIVLLAFYSEAYAQLAPWPRSEDLENTTLGSFRLPTLPKQRLTPAVQVLNRAGASQTHSSYRTAVPNFVQHVGGLSPLVGGLRSSMAMATAAEEPVAAAATSAGSLNVFGEALQSCDSNYLEGSSPGDSEPGLDMMRPVTRTKTATRAETQCDWSLESQQMCITVQDPGLQLGSVRFGSKEKTMCTPVWIYGDSWARRIREYGNGDVVVECAALPADALESDFTKATMSMSQTYYKRYTNAKSDRPQAEALEGSTRSRRFNKFNRAMSVICSSCADQATSDSARAALASKCDALQIQKVAELSFGGIGSFYVLPFVGFLVGITVTYYSRACRGASSANQEPLLAA